MRADAAIDAALQQLDARLKAPGELRDALQQLELSAYGIAEAMYASEPSGNSSES